VVRLRSRNWQNHSFCWAYVSSERSQRTNTERWPISIGKSPDDMRGNERAVAGAAGMAIVDLGRDPCALKVVPQLIRASEVR